MRLLEPGHSFAKAILCRVDRVVAVELFLVPAVPMDAYVRDSRAINVAAEELTDPIDDLKRTCST
jgi:hypothetical protein